MQTSQFAGKRAAFARDRLVLSHPRQNCAFERSCQHSESRRTTILPAAVRGEEGDSLLSKTPSSACVAGTKLPHWHRNLEKLFRISRESHELAEQLQRTRKILTQQVRPVEEGSSSRTSSCVHTRQSRAARVSDRAVPSSCGNQKVLQFLRSRQDHDAERLVVLFR